LIAKTNFRVAFDDHNNMNMIYWRTWIRGVIGILIGAVFLWLSLRQSSIEQVETILANANPGWLIIALGFYAADILVRVSRWRTLLWGVKTLSFWSVGIALIVGYASNNILPARLGELFRADFAGKRYQVSRSAIVGSIFVERVLDGLIVVLCLILGRLFVSEQPVLSSLTAVSALLFIGIFIVLWLIGRDSELNWLASLPPAIASRIDRFRQGLLVMRGPGFVRSVNLSLIVWLLEGITLWSVLKAVDVSLGLQKMLLLLGVVSLSTLIPSAPGFVGTYQYAYAFTVSLFGYEPARGVAAATAVQIFLLGSVTVIGLGIYVYLNLLKARKKS
jgi:glycosyltransferase 2 family protein